MLAATSADIARSPMGSVSWRRLRSMLCKITECLATTLAGTADRIPDWNETEWRIAQAIAIIHGISPLLAQRPEWSRGPPAWRAFLMDQRAHSIARHRRIETVLAAVGAAADRGGIPLVPLKGAALHALGLYRAGDRPMADIDLLVLPRDRQPMCQTLSALGYRIVSSSDDVEVMVPVDRPARVYLGDHVDNGVTIELHTAVRRPMPVRQIDITALLWRETPDPGPNEYPSKAALMTHLLHHAAVNMQLRVLRVVQLHDMALLAARMSPGDWQDLVGPADGIWWAAPPLILLRRYYPDCVPGDVITALSDHCTRALMLSAPHLSVADVSVSNPRRPVFPALLWSGSWSEALSSVLGRARNGARALGRGRNLPLTAELQPWITVSHRKRTLDVLLGRPRPETVMMISAALAGGFAATADQPQSGAA